MIYDFTIAGAGIVGLSTAYKLSLRFPDAKIQVVEKEDKVAAHQTGHNSGVIHSGIYYTPGSYRARNCVDGRHQLVRFSEENGVEYKLCGKVIVASDEEEVPRLDEIYRRGIENEIEGIKMLSGEELRQIEPYAAGVQAIHVPCAGIVDFPGVCQKISEKLTQTGHEVRFASEVMAVIQTHGLLTVKLKSDSVKTRFFINCAGLHSDRVAKRSGVSSPVKIVPFRGEYFKLNPEASRKVNGLIYPLPNPDFPFLGVHFTRMALGGVECGPNAVFSFKREGYKKTSFNVADTIETVDFPGFWSLSRKHWKTGLDEMYRSFYKTGFLRKLQKLIPSVSKEDLIGSPSGVRAMALGADGEILDDFYFETTENEIHVLNAPSPAATAGLAIGDEIVNRAEKTFAL